MLRFPFVEIRALMTGLMTAPDVLLLTAPHAVRFVFVQPDMLYVYPLKMAACPMTSDVSVGRIYNWLFRINELFDEAVAISNSPLLRIILVNTLRRRRASRKINSPETTHVDLVRPHARIDLRATEVVFEYQTRFSHQVDIVPAKVATYSRHDDAYQEHAVRQVIRNPRRLVLIPKPWLRDLP